MVRVARALAAAAAAVVGAGAWWAAAFEEPVDAAAPPEARVAAVPARQAEPIAPARWDVLQSALGAAAAGVCAQGCDEIPAPAAPTFQAGVVVSSEAVALPADLDVWALSPEPLLVATVPTAALRLFNTPPLPDEHDSTPADESDPYAPPVEQPAPD